MSHQRLHQDLIHHPPQPGTYYPPPQQHPGYQGYLNQGYPYPAAPPPPPNYQLCQYEHHHHHQNEHERNGCFSLFQGCLAALWCCCMMEECCFCVRCCL